MTYIITEPCIDTKDRSCVDVCPVDCIHETDRMLVVIDGRLGIDRASKPLGPGDIVKSIEFFGASHYAGEVRGRGPGQVAVLPRGAVRACLDAQGAMTWNLACALAIEAIATSKEHV